MLATLDQNHLHQPANNQHQCLFSASKKNLDGPPHSSGYTTNAGLSASLYNSLNTLLNQAHSKPSLDGHTHQSHSSTQGSPWPLSDTSQSFSGRVTAQIESQ